MPRLKQGFDGGLHRQGPGLGYSQDGKGQGEKDETKLISIATF